jgi:hypothetical protein
MSNNYNKKEDEKSILCDDPFIVKFCKYMETKYQYHPSITISWMQTSFSEINREYKMPCYGIYPTIKICYKDGEEKHVMTIDFIKITKFHSEVAIAFDCKNDTNVNAYNIYMELIFKCGVSGDEFISVPTNDGFYNFIENKNNYKPIVEEEVSVSTGCLNFDMC